MHAPPTETLSVKDRLGQPMVLWPPMMARWAIYTCLTGISSISPTGCTDGADRRLTRIDL
jgi:hypothetical protein